MDDSSKKPAPDGSLLSWESSDTPEWRAEKLQRQKAKFLSPENEKAERAVEAILVAKAEASARLLEWQQTKATSPESRELKETRVRKAKAVLRPLKRRADELYGLPEEGAEQVIAPGNMPKEPRKTWRSVAWDYMVERIREGKFVKAIDLNHSLYEAAGTGGSPFDKGTDKHRGTLWVREIGAPLGLKTIQNNWQQLKAAALKAAK